MIDDLTCKEAARLISNGLDVDLPPPVLERIRQHFLVCVTCRNVDQHMHFLRQALRGLDQDRLGVCAAEIN
jgi:hypothetical protein